MKKKILMKWLFRAYIVYSVIADIIVLTGIVYLILSI